MVALHRQQALRSPDHHQNHHQTKNQHPVFRELARQLGQHGDQNSGNDDAQLRAHAAQHRHLRTSLLAGLFKTRAYRDAEQEAMENALRWLDYMGLREFANRAAGNLAYGHQRRLEIARCMITRPRLLMLDEPAAGLNPQEKLDLQGLIERLRQEHKVTVLLIEHDMSLVMGVSERILVMEYGKPIALGTPDAIRSDERVIKAYLGDE